MNNNSHILKYLLHRENKDLKITPQESSNLQVQEMRRMYWNPK